MISTLIECLASIIELIINTDFLIRFLNNKSKYSKWICYITIFLVIGSIDIIINHFVMFESALCLIRILVIFILSTIFLQGSLFEKIFASIIGDASVLIINFSVLNVFIVLTGLSFTELIMDRGYIRLSILFITKFIFFIITRIIINVKGADSYKFTLLEWTLLGSIFIVSLLVGCSFFQMMIDNGMSSSFGVALSVAMGLMLINIITYLLMVQISKKNEEHTEYVIEKMQVELYKTKLEESKNSFDEISRFRHDMKNHLQCVDALITENELQNAKKYIKEIIDSGLNTGYCEIHTGNRVVDIILNAKILQCKKENIETVINIENFAFKIDDMDICIILGNLLDNAIEECIRAEGKKSIEFSISQNKGYVNIVIKNTIRNELIGKEIDFSTSKDNKKLHGIGLKSVRMAVKKNCGAVEFDIDRGCFIVNVLLPFVEVQENNTV